MLSKENFQTLWSTCKRIPLTDDFAQNATVDPNKRRSGRRKQIKQKLNQAETEVQLKDSMKIRASPNYLKWLKLRQYMMKILPCL